MKTVTGNEILVINLLVADFNSCKQVFFFFIFFNSKNKYTKTNLQIDTLV